VLIWIARFVVVFVAPTYRSVPAVKAILFPLEFGILAISSTPPLAVIVPAPVSFDSIVPVTLVATVTVPPSPRRCFSWSAPLRRNEHRLSHVAQCRQGLRRGPR